MTTTKHTVSRPQFDTASHLESLCRERLRALVRGEFSEDEFIHEFATVPDNITEAQWDLADWIDRQHNSGHVPDALYHSLESKIARLDGGEVDDGETAELYPLGSRRRARPPQFIEGPSALSRRAIEPGVMLRDRYLIEARIGSGGMGTVYKALDKFRGDLAETNRHVAIKILNDDITNRPEVFSKLRREFYCAQSLSHRNIVRVYELDRDGDLAFFTMEFLEGELLSRIIERFAPGTVTRSYAWRVVREVGAALSHAHARDVVHADLKPQNVLITHSGDVRLLDFGTSSANVRPAGSPEPASGSSRSGTTALTPAYASCELLEGLQPDPRDDLFAFACLTYELLVGDHPFGQRRSTEARALGLKPSRPANIGERQWAILSQGLAFNRADRSMAVRDWVQAISLPHEVSAPPEVSTLPPRATPPEISPVLTNSVPGDLPVEPVAVIPSTGMPVSRAAGANDVLDVEARPVPSRSFVAHSLLVGVLILAGLLSWTVSRRPGARVPVTAPAVVQAPNSVPADSIPAPVPARESALPRVRASAATPAVVAAPEKMSVRSVPSPAPRPPTVSAPRAPSAVPQPPESSATPVIGIERTKYWVRPGRHFAEVHVIRSAGTRGDANFVWWTEPGTAHADEDYFPQSRTTQTFSAGVRTATLFVRIMPNPARRTSRTFFVSIGSPSAGQVLGGVTRVPIVVSTRR